MIGVAILVIEHLLERLPLLGSAFDVLAVGEILRRACRWAVPRCRDRLRERADDQLRRQLERMRF